VLQISGSWLHVSAALQPSSGQLIQVKYLQWAYSIGSHTVRSFKVLDLYKLDWRWLQCGRNR